MEPKATLNLHEINLQIEELIEENVNEETGEMTEDVALMLDQLEMNRDEKVLNCARYVNEHKSASNGIAEQIKRMQARKKVHDNHAIYLSGWIESNCHSTEKFEAADLKVSFRKSTRAIAHDLSSTPHELIVIPPAPEPKLNAAGAKKWAKDHGGEAPPGVTITTHKSVQIK